METGDWILLTVVLTLAANQVLVRLPGWERRPSMFWAVQGVNLLVATYVMAIGIPGLDGPVRIFNWVIGLLFIIRTVQNNIAWGEARREAQEKARRGAGADRARIRDALRAGEAQRAEAAESEEGSG